MRELDLTGSSSAPGTEEKENQRRGRRDEASSQGVLTEALPATLPAFPGPRGLSLHSPSINRRGKAGDSTLVPVASACQSAACIQHCLTSCLPHRHLQLHERPLFSSFPAPGAWFDPGPKGQRSVPVPSSELPLPQHTETSTGQ